MTLDKPMHIFFGETLGVTQIMHWMDFAGVVQVTNTGALMTYHQGNFNILYDNHSALEIALGTVELNTNNGFESPGIVDQLYFKDGASLRINKTGVVIGGVLFDGLLRFAPNYFDAPMDFDNRAGVTFIGDGQYSYGNIQFRSFDGAGNIAVNTTLWLQDNHFAFVRPVLDAYMELTYQLRRAIVESPDATILVRLGTIPDVNADGQLAAYCPSRDGSVVGLQQGDHDVFYNSSVVGGPLDQVQGFNFNNQLFTIDNCDPATRH
jgi:hypothetical protein